MYLEKSPSPPASIKLAIKLIWASFAITVFSWILIFFTPVPENVILNAQQSGLSVNAYAIIKLGGFVIWTGFIFYVLNQIANGKNWARIICLILGVGQILYAITHFLSHFGHDSMTIIIISFVSNIFHIVFDCYALYLLFKTSGKDWFRRKISAEG